MAYQRVGRALALAFSLGASVAWAQPAEISPAPACCTVPARTPVTIELTETINSKANHSRDVFAFRLAEPLVVEGRTVAPAGTPGVGEVVHAARARAMGKAGELILAARYLQLGETRIMLRSLRYGREGRDNSRAAMATAMVATPLAFVIAGGEVNVPAGTLAQAQTAAEILLPPFN